MVICKSCRNEVDEVCEDGFCKVCHISVTWVDCITETFNAKQFIKIAMRLEHKLNNIKREAQRLYPNADIERATEQAIEEAQR